MEATSKRTSTWARRSFPTSIPSLSFGFSRTTSTPSTASSAAARSTSSRSPAPMQFHGDAFRIPAQHRSRRPQLLFSHARRIRPKPVRRDVRRPDPKEQGFSSSAIIRERDRRREWTPARFLFPRTQDRTGNLSDLASSFVTTDANGNTDSHHGERAVLGGPAFAESWVTRSRRENLTTRPDAPAQPAFFPAP